MLWLRLFVAGSLELANTFVLTRYRGDAGGELRSRHLELRDDAEGSLGVDAGDLFAIRVLHLDVHSVSALLTKYTFRA